MNERFSKDSRPLQQDQSARRSSCLDCGREYLGRIGSNSGCPYCGRKSISVDNQNDFTKKSFDLEDMDLVK